MKNKTLLPVPILNSKGNEIPKFQLKVYSFDYFSFADAKDLEAKHGVKIANNKAVPILINVDTAYAFADDQQIVQCQVKIKVNFKDKDIEFALADFKISFDYVVDSFASYADGNNTYTFSSNFLQQISFISVSTARGLLSAKFSSTYLSNLIVPLLFPTAPIPAPAEK